MSISMHPIIKNGLIIACILAINTLFYSDNVYADDISQQQLLTRMESNTAPLILDVRQPDEYAAGHVPKALNIPHTDLEKRLSELNGKKDEEIVVYCESGRRAAIAQGILKQAGFVKILHLDGDMKKWRAQNLPLE